MLVSSRPSRQAPAVTGSLLAQLRTDPQLVMSDVALVVIAYSTALLLRFDGSPPREYWANLVPFAAVAALSYVLLLARAGLYAQVWGQAGVVEAWWVGVTASVAAAALVALDLVPTAHRLLPVSVPVNAGLLLVLLLGVARFQVRVREQRRLPGSLEGEGVLVVGGPGAARAAVERIRCEPHAHLRPVAIVTDEVTAWHRDLTGVPVVGPVAGLQAFAGAFGGQQVLLLPGCDPESRARVLALALSAGLGVRSLPALDNEDRSFPTHQEPLDLAEALLGRAPVDLDLEAVRSIVAGKRVLITGAGGSIGSEIARQVDRLLPDQLVLLDHDETHLHDVMARLGDAAHSVLGDIRDEQFVDKLMRTLRPDIVFHAAAHKHVPILENFPSEAVRTNVHGTAVLVRAALRCGTARFVAISTDKAVRPRCVMGATKRLAEHIVVHADGPSRHYCAVRFGNVLGSRGSVVPTFLEQLRTGQPLTVTHPEMTRYFMTTREAVSLVLQAAATSVGGEVFVLEMGEPVRILDLAQRLIDVMQANEARHVEVRITGLRPGEKLHEELSSPDESVHPTSHPKVFRIGTGCIDPSVVMTGIPELCARAHAGRDEATRALLFELANGPTQVDLPHQLIVLPDVEAKAIAQR